LVELLLVDAVGAFEISIQARRLWPDVDVPDVRRLVMPMELRLEIGAIVRLQDEDA
jgi:hypothetical protein